MTTLSINGDVITAEEVLRPLQADLERRAVEMAAAEYERYLTEVVQSRVRAVARDLLLYQEASKNLTEAEREGIGRFADQRIRDRINEEFGGRQTRYERALAEEGLSLEQAREEELRQLIIARWIRMTIAPKVADPTRDQLWNVYESQRDTLVRPPRRKMRLIEISVLAELPPDVEAPTTEQLAQARASAREKAEEARQAILDGADFADVARRYSTGLHARDGGLWGWVTRGSVREKWEPAVEALFRLPETGTPGEIIETPDAFFIVEAVSIDPGSAPDFESIQPKLVESYRNAQFNLLVDEWVMKLQERADIRPRNVNRFLLGVLQAAPQPSSAVGP